MSDLGKRLADGDDRAFTEVVEQYSRKVYALCYRILRDQEEARDMAQDVFVKVYAKRRSFGGRSQVYTWIYRIAVNLCLSALKRRRMPTVPLEDVEACSRPRPQWRDARRTGETWESRGDRGQGGRAGASQTRSVFRDEVLRRALPLPRSPRLWEPRRERPRLISISRWSARTPRGGGGYPLSDQRPCLKHEDRSISSMAPLPKSQPRDRGSPGYLWRLPRLRRIGAGRLRGGSPGQCARGPDRPTGRASTRP